MMCAAKPTRRTCGGSTSEERSRSRDGVVRRVNLLGLGEPSMRPWGESPSRDGEETTAARDAAPI